MDIRYPFVKAGIHGAVAMTLAIAVGCTGGDRAADGPGAEGTAVTSSEAEGSAAISPELALANHLTETNSKMYGAFWCPHCMAQKETFGDAFSAVNYVECDPEGENAQPQMCVDAGIEGYPTWEINGELYPGTRSLTELAELSGYSGPTDFANPEPDAQ